VQAQALRELVDDDPVLPRQVEHITIGGEPEGPDEAATPRHRATLHRLAHASPRLGCVTELAILEGHHLEVRCIRKGAEPRRYQFDLRFANATPVRVRQVPWAWLAVSAGLVLMGGGWLVSPLATGLAVPGPGALGGLLAAVAGLFTLRAALRRTTETLQLRSLHGDAALFSIVASLGRARIDAAFLAALVDSIHAARAERAQARKPFLCDEMREHHRLHQLGILSDAEYEAAKARILAAH
jgi:hypothetical protein